MSNNSHFMAVDAAAFRYDADNFMLSPGLSWCGETFETGYVFREQLDTTLAPFLGPELKAILDGERESIAHPALDQLRSNDEGAVVTGLSASDMDAVRAAIARALADGDWGTYDTYEWDAFAADQTTGNFYVLIEFE